MNLFIYLCIISVPSFLKDICPPGWLQNGSSCYAKVNVAKPWSEAKEYCKERNAYLAEITSMPENEFVRKLFNGEILQWIGGTDADKEGSWTWAESNLPILEHNWDNGEPNDLRFKHDEDCLLIGKTGKWYDADCSWRFQFICEQRAFCITAL